MREQVGSQGGQVTVAQLPAKACPILSCKTTTTRPPPHLREVGGALRAQRVHGECARRALYTSLTNEPTTAGWAGGKPVSTSENYLQVLEMAVIKPPREIWESETTSCAHSKCFNATSVWRITNIADTKTTIGLFLENLLEDPKLSPKPKHFSFSHHSRCGKTDKRPNSSFGQNV